MTVINQEVGKTLGLNYREKINREQILKIRNNKRGAKPTLEKL